MVVKVTDKEVITIGGNVGNSVKTKCWPLEKRKIGNIDPLSPSASVICVIECRLKGFRVVPRAHPAEMVNRGCDLRIYGHNDC